MPFPYDDQNRILTDQAILAGVAGVSAGSGVFRVSAITSGGSVTLDGDAANNRVSAIQEGAQRLRVSTIQDSAANYNVSAKSNDGALLRVSAIQDGAAALNISAKSDSANLFRISSFESVVTASTGGASIYFTSSGATSQVSTVKSSTGRLYGWYIGNPAGVDQYLQIFNTSGGATAGTDTPTLSLYVPTLGGANVPVTGPGIGFSNGIQIIGTSTVNGQTIGASALRINLFYA